MTANSVFVPGVPIPQGSTRGFVVKGRAVITSANAKTNPWRADIHAALRAAVGDHIVYPRRNGVFVHLVFLMPRRAAEPVRTPALHVRKPDLDKLVRAVFDAMTGLIFEDDSQVTELLATKQPALVGQAPGVQISWDSP